LVHIEVPLSAKRQFQLFCSEHFPGLADIHPTIAAGSFFFQGTGGALNWWGLLPTFSWHGYEPDWPPICVGAFLVMMLLAIFGKVSRRRRRQQSSRDFNPHHKYPTRLKKPANRARRHR